MRRLRLKSEIFTSMPIVRRLIGTFYFVAQQLAFHNSDLNILYTTPSILMHH
jgi:hypothetical protein